MKTVEQTRLEKLWREIETRGHGGQAQIARALGVSPAQVQQWVKGVRTISSESARRIEQALAKPRGWMDRDESSSPEPSNIEPGPELGEARTVPIVGTTQAGPDGHWEELGYPPGYGDEFVEVFIRDATAYALRVKGNSMAPRIKEGEVIIASRNSEPVGGEDVVVKLTDGQVMVKSFVNRRAGQLTVQSVNNGERYVYQDSEIVFVHPVLGIHPGSAVRKR